TGHLGAWYGGIVLGGPAQGGPPFRRQPALRAGSRSTSLIDRPAARPEGLEPDPSPLVWDGRPRLSLSSCLPSKRQPGAAVPQSRLRVPIQSIASRAASSASQWTEKARASTVPTMIQN